MSKAKVEFLPSNSTTYACIIINIRCGMLAKEIQQQMQGRLDVYVYDTLYLGWKVIY